MTTPSSGASAGQCRSTASAMAAAALPAPTTTVRPRGAGGRWGGTISKGSAAATAALKLPSSSSSGVKGEIGFPLGQRRYPARSCGGDSLARRRLQDRAQEAAGEALRNADHVLRSALGHDAP